MENLTQFLQNNSWVLILLAIWAIPWKGVALWKAAQLKQKIWFIVILVANTLALLDIVYIFFIAKKSDDETLRVRDA